MIVSFHPNSYAKFYPPSGNIRRWGLGWWLGHEGTALIMGLEPLQQRLQRATLPLLPCEDRVRRQLLMNEATDPPQELNLLVP